MSSILLNTLQSTFRLNAFRPGQQQVIEALLAERSALAVFPTGGGKSLCYQLPALLQDGLTLVISPLIALMKDQVDVLRSLGVEAARLDSSLEVKEIKEIYEKMRNRQLKLLFIAPERLGNERFVQSLARTPIALLAIDEAHCISEWGHNFRPDYLKLSHHAKTLGIRKFLALTATATLKVSADICNIFQIEERDHIRTDFYRPNLTIQITPSENRNKDELLYERLRALPQNPTIVYVTLQKTAEHVADWLNSKGLNARAYHAGMKSEERSAIQEAFMHGAIPIIVATIAFGMGIDKSDIRAIYHYNLPKSLENYVQEIGRAGRDGLPSHCEILACGDDQTTLLNFSYGDTPSRNTIESVVGYVLQQEGEFLLNNYEIARTYDIRPLVLNTLLTYLELDGYIQHIGAQYETYQWKWIASANDILQKFNHERREFLSAVFASASKGRIWDKIDCGQTAIQISQPRERIVTAINYLEEQGLIQVQTSGVRQKYRLLNPSVPISNLSDDYASRFEKREQQDELRLNQVVALAEQPGCITRAITTYFGDAFEEKCNHCSDCLGQDCGPLPMSAKEEWKSEFDSRIQAAVNRHLSVLKDARGITRLLCGLSSPAISYAKLGGNPDFGCMEQLSFKTVLSKVTENLSK